MSIVLEIDKISKKFGSLIANEAVSLDLKKGEILALLGENGAGKTTLMNIIYGHYTSDSGQIRALGKSLTGGKPREAIEAGIGMVHQHFSLAGNLTVLENVMIGSFVKEDNIKKARDKALEIIDFVDLIEKRHHFARELSTGQRKRLEMARAMAIEPKLLLMDEVTGGVDQKTIPGLVELIKKLKKSGVTIITIEHNINIIMEISDNILALDQGKRIAYGTPKEIQQNEEVIDSYLGTVDAT